MALTAPQLAYLKTADQRFQAHVGLFAGYTPVITPPTIVDVTGQPLAPLPMPMCTPRHALVANGATIDLYGRDSYIRGGAYVGDANISFANTGGAGTLVDNGNGTATWTAPGGGAGTNIITMTVTNVYGSSTGLIYLQYPETTYDTTVAEVATITGDVGQHGWTVTMRVRGDCNGFVVGAGILVAITDTWDGTSSTFGGYHYPEGTFYGYITETQYFEDAFGETWLGLECRGPWNILERIKVGETWWGATSASGRFWITGFAPVDAIWHFVTAITDFAKYHNCTLFYDQNSIADLIIEESDLATIFDDVMGRTLALAFCDRYGSLLCIPDPDVRAAEWWGTPSPVFDSGGAGPLTQAYCADYQVNYYPYRQRKLSIEALDSSKLGIWAYNENTASSLGSVDKYPGKVICDNPMALASWVAQLRAKTNRRWDIDVDRFLDHTIDLLNFVDVNFTSPSQQNGSTASGRSWVSNITYRPDIAAGSWQGRWKLLKSTSGDVEGFSAWGGTGQYWGGVPGFTGPSNVSSWGPTASVSSFCHFWDFENSGRGGWSGTGNTDHSGTGGTYAPGVGWSASGVDHLAGGTAGWLDIIRKFPQRTITGLIFWITAIASPAEVQSNASVAVDGTTVINLGLTWPAGNTALTWAGAASGQQINIRGYRWNGANPPSGWILKSAQTCGLGADPFTNTATA